MTVAEVELYRIRKEPSGVNAVVPSNHLDIVLDRGFIDVFAGNNSGMVSVRLSTVVERP
jgi:hypothetical protein